MFTAGGWHEFLEFTRHGRTKGSKDAEKSLRKPHLVIAKLVLTADTIEQKHHNSRNQPAAVADLVDAFGKIEMNVVKMMLFKSSSDRADTFVDGELAQDFCESKIGVLCIVPYISSDTLANKHAEKQG